MTAVLALFAGIILGLWPGFQFGVWASRVYMVVRYREQVVAMRPLIETLRAGADALTAYGWSGTHKVRAVVDALDATFPEEVHDEQR